VPFQGEMAGWRTSPWVMKTLVVLEGEVPDIGEQGIVVAGEGGEGDAVGFAELLEPDHVPGGAGAVAGIVQLGDIAVDDEFIGVGPEGAQGVGTARAHPRAAEVGVGDHHDATIGVRHVDCIGWMRAGGARQAGRFRGFPIRP
jgi:hypothetical protein